MDIAGRQDAFHRDVVVAVGLHSEASAGHPALVVVHSLDGERHPVGDFLSHTAAVVQIYRLETDGEVVGHLHGNRGVALEGQGVGCLGTAALGDDDVRDGSDRLVVVKPGIVVLEGCEARQVKFLVFIFIGAEASYLAAEHLFNEALYFSKVDAPFVTVGDFGAILGDSGSRVIFPTPVVRHGSQKVKTGDDD